MLPKINFFIRVIFTLGLFISLPQVAIADEKVISLEKIMETLKSVEKYDYGQSRESLVYFSGLVRTASTQDTLLPELEEAMLNLLKSDATFAAKQFICQELSLIGTGKSVKILTGLLKDDKTADIARYALERIPDEKVDDALRNAAQQSSGLVKVGIINTLGQRRDIKSLKLFKKWIGDPDPMVSEAAISAAGKLATVESADVLNQALIKAPEQKKIRILNALLAMAGELRSENQNLASALYQELYTDEKPFHVRAAALRGLIMISGNDAVTMIKQAIQEDAPVLKSTAFSLIPLLPENADIMDVVSSMPVLEPPLEVQLLAALRDRADKRSLDTVRRALKSTDEPVRIAALDALTVLGDAGDVTAIAGRAANSTGPEKETARTALYRLNGPGVDNTIIAEIDSADVTVQCELIRSVSQRPILTASQKMFERAKDEDSRVRTESIKALAVIAQPDALPALIDLLVTTEPGAEMNEAQKTITLVSRKIEDQSSQSDAILSALVKVNNLHAYNALLEVLGRIGSPKSMPVLRNALKSKKAETRLSAIRALSDWPGEEPMADLLVIAQHAGNEKERILALRGYIALVKESELDDADKVAAYQSAYDLAEQVNEKRQVLSGLSEIGSLASLEILGAQLENAELRAEAEAGIMNLRWELMKSHPQELKIFLKRIVEITEDEQNRNDAKEVLDKLK
jgi:HEAT repeat protein